MSHTLRLPLTLALIAFSVLVAASRADAVTPTPVLWGGKVTTEGTGTSSASSETSRSRSGDSFSLHFHTERIVPDLYTPLGEGVGLIDDGGSGQGATKWDATIGTGTAWYQPSHLDDDDNVVWDKKVSCTVTGTQPDPGGLFSPDKDEDPRILWASPLQRIVDLPSTCDNGRDNDTTAWSGGDLAWDVNDATQFDLEGKQPPTRTTWTKPFGLNVAKADERYSANGTMTIECALCVTDMRLEHRDQSANGSLIDVPDAGTTDGNRVWATAKVSNKTEFTYKAAVQWRERTSGRYLMSVGAPNPIVTFPAHQTTTVVLEMDTSGFAYEKGAPRSDREIELMTPLGGGFVKVKVLPKPVVMVHGWKANASGWDAAKGLVGAVHPQLPERAFAVGDGKAYGIMDTDPSDGKSIGANAEQESQYVDGIRSKVDAEHVDLLVHSMGGLISRAYINSYMPESKDGFPVVSHLLMFGTPNMGSPCADLMAPVLRGIPTQQLRPAFVDGIFNKSIVNAKRVPFAIVAGDILPTTCGTTKEGDGVVEVDSAYWTIADRSRISKNHIGLTDVPELYSNWVKNRIALDPDQARNLGQYDPASLPRRATGAPETVRTGAPATSSGSAAAPAEPLDVAVARTVTVPAGGSVDVPITVQDGTALVVGHDAPGGVAAKLVAPSGASVAIQAAGSEEAAQAIRVQRVASPMAGEWKLRLSQSGGAAATVHASLAVAGSALRLTMSSTATELRATVTEPGATVTAELRSSSGASKTVALTPDADGKTFRAATKDLGEGEWFAVVTAKLPDGRERIAAATVGVASGGDDPTPGGDHGGDPSPGGDPSNGGDHHGGDPSDGGPSAPGRSTPSPSPKTGGAATPGPSAGGPAKRARLTLSATARRDRRKPYTFALSGKLIGVAKCKGIKIAVQLASGKKVIASKQVALGAKCTFSTKVSVKMKGSLKAVARQVGGTAVSATVGLRAG